MKLTEITDQSTPVPMTEKSKKFLEESVTTGTWSYNDGYVDIDGFLTVETHWREIPIPIGRVTKTFMLKPESKLDSLVNCPREIGVLAMFNTARSISTIEGLPRRVGLTLDIRRTAIHSLSGIHEHVNFVGERLCAGSPTQPPVAILGVFLIDGLQTVWFEGIPNRINQMINNHLANDKDLAACQEELIVAGFQSLAEL